MDLGCGVGRVISFLGDRAQCYCGLDISLEMVRGAKETYTGKASVFFINGDASLVPFGDSSFDFITCFGLFEYLDNIELYLNEVRRLLKKDGSFIFTVHTEYGSNQS